MIEDLKSKLLAERRKNLVQEIEIRKEMGDAMTQQIIESEERRWYVDGFDHFILTVKHNYPQDEFFLSLLAKK